MIKISHELNRGKMEMKHEPKRRCYLFRYSKNEQERAGDNLHHKTPTQVIERVKRLETKPITATLFSQNIMDTHL